MLDQDLIQNMMVRATEENNSISDTQRQKMQSLLIKVVQLEQFTDKDIKTYLMKICNNQMTVPVIEVMLSLIRLYPLKRLQELSHINNPIAFSVVKDIEDYLLHEISCILQMNKENLIVNHTKVSLIMSYIKKRSFIFFKLCKMLIRNK